MCEPNSIIVFIFFSLADSQKNCKQMTDIITIQLSLLKYTPKGYLTNSPESKFYKCNENEEILALKSNKAWL